MDSRLIKITADAGITFPTLLPLFHNQPNKKLVQKWVENHHTPEILAKMPEIARIAKKLADNFNYISFERFLEQLKITVNAFHEKTDQPYVIWIPKADITKDGCSELWVIGLALEYCGLRCPEDIVATDKLADYLIDNPEIKNILILNDAIYSGLQFKRELHDLEIDLTAITVKKREKFPPKYPLYQLYIGIPFVSSVIHKIIVSRYAYIKPLLLDHSSIPTVEEILNEKQNSYLKNNSIEIQGKTTTYFQHRYADPFSTYPCLKSGEHMLRASNFYPAMRICGYVFEKDEENAELTVITNEQADELADKFFPNCAPLIPEVIKPYGLNNKIFRRMLFEPAVKEDKVGLRTSYAIPTENVPAFLVEVHAILQKKGLLEPIKSSQQALAESIFSFFHNSPVTKIILDYEDEMKDSICKRLDITT